MTYVVLLVLIAFLPSQPAPAPLRKLSGQRASPVEVGPPKPNTATARALPCAQRDVPFRRNLRGLLIGSNRRSSRSAATSEDY